MAIAHWVDTHWIGTSAAGRPSPAAPVLSVVDHSDGTVTATVAGSSAGSVNTLSTLSIDDEFGTSDWIEREDRVGDGDVELSLARGYYWMHCRSGLNGVAAVSNLVYLRVTDGTPPVLKRILDAVQARIRSLSLAGIASEAVIVRDVPSDRNVATKPCIIIAPFREEQMPPLAGTNERDEVGYPIIVALVDHKTGSAAGESAYAPDSTARFQWRQDLIRAFRHQRLPGEPEAYSVRIEPLHIVDAEAWFQRNVHYSGLILRVLTREPRGIA